VVDYLSAIDYIPVRLADLDTITVTFRREEATGNLIAVSSRRNPLNESVLPFHTYLQVLRGEAEFFEQRSYHSAPDEQSPGGQPSQVRYIGSREMPIPISSLHLCKLRAARHPPLFWNWWTLAANGWCCTIAASEYMAALSLFAVSANLDLTVVPGGRVV